jgi:hypothetical protein
MKLWTTVVRYFKWVVAVYCFNFGPWDYTRHQCDATQVIRGSMLYVCCLRCRNHPGNHRSTNREWNNV